MNVNTTKKTGRPVKRELSFYKRKLNVFEDFRIIALLHHKGTLGYTIFDFLIERIFHNGYFLDEAREHLRLAIIRGIDSRNIDYDEQVFEIIDYCCEIGLLDKELWETQGVLTSVEIQQIYDEICARRKADKSMYWLLKEEVEDVFTAEKRLSAAESAQEKEEEKEEDKEQEKEKEKPKVFSIPTLSDVRSFCEENALAVDPDRFWNYYEAVDWKMNGQRITNWQALLSNWNRNERGKHGRNDAEKPKHTPSYDLSAYEDYDIFAAKDRETKQSA